MYLVLDILQIIILHKKPKPYGPWEASFSTRRLIFWGEDISMPETQPIRKSYIPTQQHRIEEKQLLNYPIHQINGFKKYPVQCKDTPYKLELKL